MELKLLILMILALTTTSSEENTDISTSYIDELEVINFGEILITH